MKKPKIIKTLAQLARRIELSRPTLRKYLALSGAPKKGKEGYDLAAVAGFIADNSEREATAVKASPDLKAARAKEIHLRCARLKLFLDRERGLYVLKAEVKASITRIMGPMVQHLEQKLVNEYPNAVAGLDVPQARILGKRVFDEIMVFCESLKNEWPK
jgi:hypothetical protein